MRMIALIDADIVAYRAAASCEPTKKKPHLEDEGYAVIRARDTMINILEQCRTREYIPFLSGGENFRKIIYPAYKANRDNVPRPVHLQPVREYLIDKWNAKLAIGYEADDALGIHHNENTIICSIDKDLLQLPGRHFNFVKNEHRTITELEARKTIYWLLLVGDTSDNIQGVYGIGPVKASRIVDGHANIETLHEEVRTIYNDDARFNLNLRLITVLRSEDEYDALVKGLNENSVSKSKGSQPSEESGNGDFSPFSTINS